MGELAYQHAPAHAPHPQVGALRGQPEPEVVTCLIALITKGKWEILTLEGNIIRNPATQQDKDSQQNRLCQLFKKKTHQSATLYIYHCDSVGKEK